LLIKALAVQLILSGASRASGVLVRTAARNPLAAVSGRAYTLSYTTGKKQRPPGGGRTLKTFDFALADGRCVRAGHRYRLARLNDVSGLGVIRTRPGEDTETSHRNPGHERDNHDFQVRRTVR
jgi:hypothetical protein